LILDTLFIHNTLVGPLVGSISLQYPVSETASPKFSMPTPLIAPKYSTPAIYNTSGNEPVNKHRQKQEHQQAADAMMNLMGSPAPMMVDAPSSAPDTGEPTAPYDDSEMHSAGHDIETWREVYVHLSMCILHTKRVISFEKEKLNFMLHEIMENVNEDGTLVEEVSNEAEGRNKESTSKLDGGASGVVKKNDAGCGGVKVLPWTARWKSDPPSILQKRGRHPTAKKYGSKQKQARATKKHINDNQGSSERKSSKIKEKQSCLEQDRMEEGGSRKRRKNATKKNENINRGELNMAKSESELGITSNQNFIPKKVARSTADVENRNSIEGPAESNPS